MLCCSVQENIAPRLPSKGGCWIFQGKVNWESTEKSEIGKKEVAVTSVWPKNMRKINMEGNQKEKKVAETRKKSRKVSKHSKS